MNKLFLVLLLIAQSAFAITSNRAWLVPNGGILPSWNTIDLSTSIVTGLLPRGNVGSPTVTYGTPSTTTTSAGTFISTGASITINNTGGGTIAVGTTSAASSSSYCTLHAGSANAATGAQMIIKRDSTPIGGTAVFLSTATSTNASTTGSGNFTLYDSPGTGSHTYVLWLASSSTSDNAAIGDCRIFGYAL